jgi:fluoride exporter
VERDRSASILPMQVSRRASPSLLRDRQELAAIFVGGFLGTVARGALAQSVTERADRWPWATFAVNMLGAALLGYLITRLQERLPPTLYRRALLGTGLCGALTTFSTMALELAKMIEAGQPALAAAYAIASIAGGFALVFVATKLVRRAGVRR